MTVKTQMEHVHVKAPFDRIAIEDAVTLLRRGFMTTLLWNSYYPMLQKITGNNYVDILSTCIMLFPLLYYVYMSH